MKIHMNNNTDVNYTLSNIEVGFGVFKVLFVSDPNIDKANFRFVLFIWWIENIFLWTMHKHR